MKGVSGKTAYRILSTEGADNEAKKWYFADRSDNAQLTEFVEEAKRDGRGLIEIYWLLATDDPCSNNHIKMQIGRIFGCY